MVERIYIGAKALISNLNASILKYSIANMHEKTTIKTGNLCTVYISILKFNGGLF